MNVKVTYVLSKAGIREFATYRWVEDRDDFGVWHETYPLMSVAPLELTECYLIDTTGAHIPVIFSDVFFLFVILFGIFPRFWLSEGLSQIFIRVRNCCCYGGVRTPVCCACSLYFVDICL